LYTGPDSDPVDSIDFSSLIVATDNDGDEATLDAAKLFTIAVQDDVPEVVDQPEAISATVEEDDMTGSAGGDLSTGNNEDGSSNQDEASSTVNGSIASLFTAGADEDLSFSLSTDTSGLPSLYSQGEPVLYIVEDNVLTAYVDGGLEGTDDDRVVFTLTMHDDGSWDFDLQDQLDHVDDGANDENTALYTGEGNDPVDSIDFSSLLIATDFDGDEATLDASNLFTITVEDDIPVVGQTSNLVYANSLNDGSTDAWGIFQYSVGADERNTYSSSSSDFAAITFSGLVGELAISNTDVNWLSENGTTATFEISFDYASNPNTPNVLTHATGTLVFDKEAGTYTVSLDDTIKGYTVLTTSNVIGDRDSYDLGGSPKPEIVVSQLDNSFFVRFTGGSGSFATTDGDKALETNEVFTGTQTWVSVSGSENGIASDTLQRGEVLNMDFYTSDPGGAVNPGAGDARADGIYLKLAKWIPGEDMIVLLKLIDPDNNTMITRAIVVESGDIYTGSNPYNLTGADGYVIIESNDYNINPGENYQIYGMQLLVSTEDITGSGINLNRDTGDSGGSSTMQDFDANPTPNTGTTDTDVIKIVDVGIITSQNNELDAQLTFDVTVQDADGDSTGTQQLDVTITNSNILAGSGESDTLHGTAAANILQGGAGDDWLVGGGGSDTLTGGADNDTFVWEFGDQGTPGTPVTDTVTDFARNPVDATQKDMLDLSDLLQGEDGMSNTDLGKYLHFSDDGAGGTLVQISSGGQFNGSNYATATDQAIVLQGVNYDLLGSTSDADIINLLKTNQNLKTD
ncbi:type I secretion C-terminal target domain-containing protein, partial [Vogesella amnigena]